jgi:hypothetical protein
MCLCLRSENGLQQELYGPVMSSYMHTDDEMELDTKMVQHAIFPLKDIMYSDHEN